MNAPDSQPPTKKRKRMHYACVECNRRKHKCDRKIPCGPCTQRGIADGCRPFEDGDEHGDLRARLSRVEHLLDGLLARETSQPRSESIEDREEHLDGGLTGAAGNYFGGNALPSVTSTSIEAEVRGNPSAAPSHSNLKARTTQANFALRQVIAEGGARPDVLLSLLSELPPKDDIGALLDIFFRDINPVRFPLPEREIRRAFDDLNAFTWSTAREDGDDGASHLNFLPLLFMIIATATFCLPLAMSKRIDVKAQAKRYYHSYRRASSIASLLPATTTLLCANLLATRFLIIIRTPADAWSILGATLRTAQALGLHRDGARLGLPAFEAERRRRLWAHLFYADASLCIMLGRPMAIRPADCDTLPPGKVPLGEDEQDHVPDELNIWEDRPTRWTFIALRHALAQISSRVVEHFQDLAGGRHYDTVLALDKQIVTFCDVLPPAYRLDAGEKARAAISERQRGRQPNGRQDIERDKSRSSDRGTVTEGSHPDDSTDEPNAGQPRKPPPYDDAEPGAYPMLPTHRFMINTEIQYVRIALHRPYVLRADEKYGPSRNACFEAARIDRQAREVFRREVQWPDHRARRDHMGGLYRLFNSTMILGIALLLNPAGPNAAELRGYLDDFIQLHVAQAAHDPTSAREVKIIQLFRAKADDALRLRSPAKNTTPQMTREPPNGAHSRHNARAFSLDSHNPPIFPSTRRTSPPQNSVRINSPPAGARRPRSRTSLSSVLIPNQTPIDNPPLPPGVSPPAYTSQAFSPTTTFAVSNHRRSPSVSLSPTTPREAQALLSPAPRAVSPFLMLGLGTEGGTPPTSNPALTSPNSTFGQNHDMLPLHDDTQALFDQASWQYALANSSSMGLGFDWTSGGAGAGLGLGLGFGVPELGVDAFGFGYGPGGDGSALGNGNGNARSDASASPPTLLVTQPDAPGEDLLAPQSEDQVKAGRSGGPAKGRAPEGWGYWEGLVDAIVNQQGIGARDHA
ncbi:Fungal specific transcription factor domain containing protein [Ceratobasidium theobromae]|uniref:Fungal specific transcription factor domain containing protein n=1 Tax=Ceratobasidium theobromae TaxID=1582974 RepID=A0A5N5QD14_9AGAM|nr:Fungal specific transcription factor domain containing protein [Ceratobasidium theobromae]